VRWLKNYGREKQFGSDTNVGAPKIYPIGICMRVAVCAGVQKIGHSAF
jgi:hypothetical protein